MSFDYVRAGTVAEASALLAGDGAVALGGGTDLMVAIRHRKVAPTLVVDLKHVADIGDRIDEQGGWLDVGGKVTMGSLIADERIRTRFGALAEAASVVGSVQIRNRATLAGNLCNASPAADTAPVLLAFGAEVEIGGPTGGRTVPLSEFFVGPGRSVLGRGELVTNVRLPAPGSRVGSAFARVTRRRGVDLATVNLACVVTPEGSVRFGFGAVAPTPVAAGSTLDDLESEDGWEALFTGTSPISDVRARADYRNAMLRVHARRALSEARARMEAG